MPDGARANGDVIRKVSKATALLQAFAMVLLIGLIYLMSGIYQRYEALQDGVRENALWSVYQLDREARRLNEEANIMLATGDFSSKAAKALSTRYDILYSRMSILKRANFDLRLSEDPQLGEIVKKIEPLVMFEASWFDALAKGKSIDRDRLQGFADDIAPLVKNTEALLTQVNNKVSTDRAEARDALQMLQIKTGALTVVLAASVGFLVFSLRRQLRSVRSAGLAFEGLVRELREAYSSAEAGNRAKSQFMATMGHEVRTPLNAILGTAELLELGDLPDKAKMGVQTIRRSGQTLLEILNEILDFAKMETGRIDVSLAPVNIVEVVTSAVEMMQDRAAENGDTLVADIGDAGAADWILTDATRVRQVVLNLLSNAVKFTSDGAVVLKMTRGMSEGTPVIRLAVSDTGIGIDEAGQEKLFKPFSQVDATISRKYGGTGLGLTICKEIIDALGGTIGVASVTGAGSTFWFEIPAQPVAEVLPVAGGPRDKGPDASSLPPLRVLLVEDNLVNQQVAAGFLRHLHQDFVVASDGLEAVMALSERDFDLVLMDMQMPNMDGIEATRHIRQMQAPVCNIPIVAMTANASDDDRSLCVEAGMSDFQSKPLTLAQLAAVIAGQRPGEPSAPDRKPTVEVKVNDRQRELIEVLGEDGLAELLDSFFSDAVSILSGLAVALREGDPRTLDRMLHSLKGAAGNVGLQDIADRAQRLREAPVDQHELLEIAKAVDEQRQAYAA
ncbi:ATP-binding protein [Rhizobium sp. BE258]|uniref:ATP-binding protein n=1 Tax=Rhizobium sp. BE258 TaxID=2817722 RepID=UPI0028645BBD|nr:ATP-binding protein [Rhizobium sp. BE258]MDR7145477.1 signal transduction histidine kinase/CheY-like chemotaxis protein [Rhizobium sp. BE258]